MSDFQCKFYLLDGAETLECKDGNAEYVAKIADRPFPDSLLSFVYYDVNQWEPRFHEAERELIKFYQTRDTTCLKPVQKLLDDFKDGHPYFFYLWLDWSNRLKQATPDCKNPTKLLPHKELDTSQATLRPCSSKFCACSRRFWTQASQMSAFPFGCRRMNKLHLCRNSTSSR